VHWWLKCPKVIDASFNDFDLSKKMVEYQSIDSGDSESAIRAFNRHLWYLTSEYVPITPFCDEMENDQKRKIVAALHSANENVTSMPTLPSTRFGTGYGTPKFFELPEVTELSELVDIDFWFFFQVLGIKTNFLNQPICEWPRNASYKAAKQKI